MITGPKDYFYFIPVVGMFHYVSERLANAQELKEISQFVPPSLRGRMASILPEDLIPEIESLPVSQKIRISNCFARRNHIAELSYVGSVAQFVIALLTYPHTPAFFPFLRLLSAAQNLFLSYKFFSPPFHYYHYDQRTGEDGREYAGNGLFKFLNRFV